MNERPGGDMRRRELGPASSKIDRRKVNPYLLTFEKAPGWGDSRVVKKASKKASTPKKISAADAFEAASRRARKKTIPKKPRTKKRAKEVKDETTHFIDERLDHSADPNDGVGRFLDEPKGIKIVDQGNTDDPIKVNGDEALFNEKEIAKATGRHESSIKRWIAKPWFPKKVAGVWLKSQVIAAVNANTRIFKKRKKNKPKVGSFFSPPKSKGSLDRLCKLYDLKVAIASIPSDSPANDYAVKILNDLIGDEKELLKS